MKIKDSAEQITWDLFQNCDVPEEVTVTFDPEVDLNDNAVGRSCYKQFYFVHRKLCERKSKSSKFVRTQSSAVPLKEL